MEDAVIPVEVQRGLATAIISQALWGGLGGNEDDREWLTKPSKTLSFWCELLDLEPSWVNKQAAKAFAGDIDVGEIKADMTRIFKVENKSKWQTT